MLREAKKQREELKKETVDSFHSEFPAGDEGSSQVTGFVECIVLECVVFSVWIKVRVKADGRAGAWELSNASSIIASMSAAFKINTFTYSTQPAVKKKADSSCTNNPHTQKHTTPADKDYVRLNASCNPVPPFVHTHNLGSLVDSTR